MPIRPDTKWPPSNGHGCDSAPCGTANSIAAVAYNALFPWRRYPAHLVRAGAKPADEVAGYAAISHEDFVYALAQMDSFIDVSEEDLRRIYSLATGRHHADAGPGE